MQIRRRRLESRWKSFSSRRIRMLRSRISSRGTKGGVRRRSQAIIKWNCPSRKLDKNRWSLRRWLLITAKIAKSCYGKTLPINLWRIEIRRRATVEIGWRIIEETRIASGSNLKWDSFNECASSPPKRRISPRHPRLADVWWWKPIRRRTRNLEKSNVRTRTISINLSSHAIRTNSRRTSLSFATSIYSSASIDGRTRSDSSKYSWLSSSYIHHRKWARTHAWNI